MIILQSSVKDQICWDRSLHEFSVKSIYQFLQGASYHKTQLANIWKLQISPRIIVFMWLVLRNFIITIDNLKKRR
jgi:zinc-binding in reverse transcriptase